MIAQKVIVIGSNGTLGQEFLRVYSDASPIGWDREQIDIADPATVERKIAEIDADIVINCAAYNAVDKAEEDGETADAINGYGPGYLAQSCRKLGAVLVHFSSNYVFAGDKEGGYNEDDQPKPCNRYGQSKLLGEKAVLAASDLAYVIRTSMLFGKTGNGKRSFVDLMAEKGSSSEPIKAVEDEIGAPTYAVDLAQATRALLEERKPFGIYHLVNSGQASWYDWAREIFRLKGLAPEVIPVKGDIFNRPARRPLRAILNNNKFLQLRPWNEALEEFLSPDRNGSLM